MSWIINSFYCVTWHIVTGNFLFSSLPDSNLFSPSPHCLIWHLGLFAKGLSVTEAHNYHSKSIDCCYPLEAQCHFATFPFCDWLPNSTSLLLFVFSTEVKYNNCSLDNGGCEHFCREDPAEQHRLCSCASGYRLKDDHTTCEPVGKSRMYVVQLW